LTPSTEPQPRRAAFTHTSGSAAAPAAAPATTGAWWYGLLALAIALRVAVVFVLPRTLQWRDAQEFEAVARDLVEHGTYGLQTLRPPGYPTLIAAVYRVFGENLLPLRLVEALLAAIAVGLIGKLGARLFGERAGMIAMALAALHPMLSFMPATGYSESTSALLYVLVVWFGFSALERGGTWRWALAGVLLGVSTLVRPNAIMLMPGLGLGFALLLHRRRRGWLVPIVVTGLAFALTLAPWMIRNHNVHHRWFFISTGGGRQLWLGNNINSTCITTEDPIMDAETKAALARLEGFFDQDRYLYGEAMRFIREHPGRAAQLYLVKLGNIFALFPETLTRTYVNAASRVTQGIASVVIFLGTLLGLRFLRREPSLWPLVLGTLSFLLPTALVFSSMRYRILFEPCLILIAGLGFARLLPGGSRPGAAPRAS
jgi:4-amino-4-deoxy-L-arabinose transferase-like glycosyltransferase